TYAVRAVSLERVGYDADTGRLTLRLNGEEYWFLIPVETARKLADGFWLRLEGARIERRLGEEHAAERGLADTATSARFDGISPEGERQQRKELALITWIDPQTGLMWPLQDNKKDMDWNAAGQHCRQLRLGGFSDWRLPEIGELAGIYDASLKQQYKVKGNIQLSSYWAWSATKDGAIAAPAFIFHRGGQRYS